MFDAFGEVNWLAVLLATLAYYLLGALWFTPLFGWAWDRALGFERPRGNRFPPLYYVMPLLSSALASVATAVLAAALRVEQLGEAIVLGALVGVGYALAVSFNNAVNPRTPRPLLYGAVTGGYHVVGLLVVSVIVVAIG